MQIQSARGLGGWVLADSEQPTSDVQSVTFTGLSTYRHIRLVAVFQTSGLPANVTIAGRVSGGTWRELGDSGSAQVNARLTLSVEVFNFGSTDTFKIVTSRFKYDDTAVLDNTDDIGQVRSGNTVDVGQGFASYQEVWDEMQVDVGGGQVIEGSTAGQRGYFYVFGMK